MAYQMEPTPVTLNGLQSPSLVEEGLFKCNFSTTHAAFLPDFE